MNLMNFDMAAGRHTRAAAAESAELLPVSASFQTVLEQYSGTPIKEVSLIPWQNQQVYRVKTNDRRFLHNAVDGGLIEIDAQVAEGIARASYTGPGRLVKQELLTKFNTETRHYQGASWAHHYDDGDATTVYVSAEDGRVLAHRNNEWRRFDFFWMLHILDFDRREDINNSLGVSFAFGSLWLAMTGLILIITSLRRSQSNS